MGDDCGCDGDSDTDVPEAEDVGDEPVEGGPPLDEVLDCLRSSTRRRVLYYLRDSEIASVEELATHVAAAETDRSPDDVPDDRRERVETRLVHTHLPKLARSNVVQFDHRSQTIRYTDPPGIVAGLLELVARFEDGS